jgi:formate dehydrogenase subunit gamma
MHQEWSPEMATAVLSSIDDPGPVLIALQALQDTFGYVHPDAVSLVAKEFNVSRADVYGVLTFYSDLRTTAPADVEVRVCMGEACQAVGARALRAQADTLVGPSCDVQSVFCLGNCALGPSAVVNGRILGRVTGAALATAVSNERSGA